MRKRIHMMDKTFLLLKTCTEAEAESLSCLLWLCLLVVLFTSLWSYVLCCFGVCDCFCVFGVSKWGNIRCFFAFLPLVAPWRTVHCCSSKGGRQKEQHMTGRYKAVRNTKQYYNIHQKHYKYSQPDQRNPENIWNTIYKILQCGMVRIAQRNGSLILIWDCTVEICLLFMCVWPCWLDSLTAAGRKDQQDTWGGADWPLMHVCPSWMTA